MKSFKFSVFPCPSQLPHSPSCCRDHTMKALGITLCSAESDLQPLGLQPIRLHGASQARILESVAISSSRGSSQPRDGTWISCISCTGRWWAVHRHATWEAWILLCQGTFHASVVEEGWFCGSSVCLCNQGNERGWAGATCSDTPSNLERIRLTSGKYLWNQHEMDLNRVKLCHLGEVECFSSEEPA